MRLINVHTYELEDVVDETGVRYAILSHRWEQEEVSFQDFQNLTIASAMTGFEKIKNTCSLAKDAGLHYAWVDTCCIDKSSSAELSEAINSMFRWYAESAKCYAHLSDIDRYDHDEARIGQSAWFTRGWTLQELLAPSDMEFFDRHWESLGTRDSLKDQLCDRTGIDVAILTRKESLHRRSIAQRMSWAAERVTTRQEDLAYCLIGIFDVNMPLLYGEGKVRAFYRLQAEVIKESDDHSIFAWPLPDSNDGCFGLLAPSPANFRDCGTVEIVKAESSAYSLTNRGLSITLLATPYIVDTYLVRLNCVDTRTQRDARRGLRSEKTATDGHTPQWHCWIFLMRSSEDLDQYVRIKCQGNSWLQFKTPYLLMTIQERITSKELVSKGEYLKLCDFIHFNVQNNPPVTTADAYSKTINGFYMEPNLRSQWCDSTSGRTSIKVRTFIWEPSQGAMILPSKVDYNNFPTLIKDRTVDIDLRDQSGFIEHIRLGFDFEFHPVCFIKAIWRPSENPATYMENEEAALERSMQQLDIFHRSPYDLLAWSRTADVYKRSMRAYPLEYKSNLWALKGGRHGLNMELLAFGSNADALNLNLKFKACGHVQIRRISGSGWEFSVKQFT